MSTYKEIIYMIQDQLKLVSDDSYYTTDHIRYLINKFRAYVLKKTYSDVKKAVPESNYQIACITLENFSAYQGTCGEESFLRSVEEVPALIDFSNPIIGINGITSNYIYYVSKHRFAHVGYNKYTRNFIYATLGADGHLYLKSYNPQYKYLEKLSVTGVFENPDAVPSCEDSSTSCDPLDREFPLEEAFVPYVIETVTKMLSGSLYIPKDDSNNASDDLSEIMSYIRRNMKSNLQKQLSNDTTV